MKLYHNGATSAFCINVKKCKQNIFSLALLQQLVTCNEKLEQRKITTMVSYKCLICIFTCFRIEHSVYHPHSFDILKFATKVVLVKTENNNKIDGDRIIKKLENSKMIQ